MKYLLMEITDYLDKFSAQELASFYLNSSRLKIDRQKIRMYADQQSENFGNSFYTLIEFPELIWASED